MALGSAGDLDFMLKDAGVPVSYLPAGRAVAITGYGIFSIEDTQEINFSGATIVGRKYRVTVSNATFPMVAENDSIEVDGVVYRVTQKWLKSDGKLADVWLSAY